MTTGGIIPMNTAQKKKFNSLYQQHVNALRRQGKAASTIDTYSRAIRRITEFYDPSGSLPEVSGFDENPRLFPQY